MPITLASPVTLSAGTRVGIFLPGNEDETAQRYVVIIDLRTAAPPNQVIARHYLEVRNGHSDRVVRGAPAAGEHQAGFLKLERNALVTPTGYTDLAEAVDAETTKAAKRAAAEAFLVGLGVIDPATLGA